MISIASNLFFSAKTQIEVFAERGKSVSARHCIYKKLHVQNLKKLPQKERVNCNILNLRYYIQLELYPNIHMSI